MRGRRSPRPARPRPDAAAAPPRTRLVWGDEAELRANRRGELHPTQRTRIKQISIFDPWMRLVFGAFFIVFGLTQRLDSWQSWLPLAMGALPVFSGLNGVAAGRRLARAGVEMVEGQVAEVRPQRSDAVSARLLRDGRTLFLLACDGAATLPQPATEYRFYAVFGVIRPPIVVAIESLE